MNWSFFDWKKQDKIRKLVVGATFIVIGIAIFLALSGLKQVNTVLANTKKVESGINNSIADLLKETNVTPRDYYARQLENVQTIFEKENVVTNDSNNQRIDLSGELDKLKQLQTATIHIDFIIFFPYLVIRLRMNILQWQFTIILLS